MVSFFLVISFGRESLSAESCFAGSLPFFQNFEKLAGSSDEKNGMLSNACREIQNFPEMNETKSIFGKMGATLVVGGIGIMFGGGLASFDSLQGTQKQRLFMSQLEEIKKIPNAMDRIRKVYELVSRTQGKYDHESMGMKSWKSGYFLGANRPSNLINNAESNGTVGVCREMASLLQWSLLQVSRWSGSTGMALGPNDFSSDLTGGQVPGRNGWKDGGGHAWVRVNLPQFVGKQLKSFNTFDLDTTWYGEKFSPLLPRRAGLKSENILKINEQCIQISRCLNTETLRTSGPSMGIFGLPAPLPEGTR